MKIVLLSNFFNHHQKPISDAFFEKCDGNYSFIATKKMSDERKKLGWSDDAPQYVKFYYEDEKSKLECDRLIDEADAVIYGSAPYEIVAPRLKKNKLTLLYSERPYKDGYNILRILKHTVLFYFKYGRYGNAHCLCASAYTAGDFAMAGLFKNKTYKWGYFPELRQYEDITEIMNGKQQSSILWVSRYLKWKRPEIPVRIAERLKQDGYSFCLNMVGTGEMLDEIKKTVEEKGLSDCVHILGAMKPQEVRMQMEKSEIFLFSSDFNEGWGAVLNESMNSGCAVVASHAIGSVPFLLDDRENGLIYECGDFEDAYSKVKSLLDNHEKSRIYGECAYNTICNAWNADTAADRLIELCGNLLEGRTACAENGPCSKAELLKNGWYCQK